MELEDTGGGGSLGGETVYGTHEDSHVVMSEKVQSLAGSIYQEFERMIARYDEDVVKTLMPLLVNVLECLDAAYQINQEHDVELELLREDNEQLVTQYEREKGGRKAAEQKLLEMEDSADAERKELTARLEALESIVRMLELKHKNGLEHASRLEEREGELKKEYAKLHERYTELFKTHVDYMERTKLLLSGGQLAQERSEAGGSRPAASSRLQSGRSSGPVSFGFASLDAAGDGVDSVPTSPVSSLRSSPSLHSELDIPPSSGAGMIGIARTTMERSQETDAISLEHRGTATTPGTPPTPAMPAPTPVGRSQTKREQRSANTLYQELSYQDAEALADVDEGADITGSWVHPGEYASSVNDNFFGMGKEVENLIMENNELLATKNALNIVKDDLIVKVDELTGEQEILREQIRTLMSTRDRLTVRVAELDDELRLAKEAAERATAAAAATSDGTIVEYRDDENDVPMAQRKRFTRAEMARVLMERNQYKERFMELQEAVRWTEMVRATRNEPSIEHGRQSIWKFFSNLFNPNPAGVRPGSVDGSHHHHHAPLVSVQLKYHTSTGRVAPNLRALPSSGGRASGADYFDADLGSDRATMRRANERKEQYRQVRAHVRKEDGRLQAYGWSLPSRSGGVPGSAVPAITASTVSSRSSGSGGAAAVPVPVPVYCRPLAETSPSRNIWCAAGVNLTGGVTRDGGLMVGGSVFYSDPVDDPASERADDPEIEALDRELTACRTAALLETRLSSYVWIGTSTNTSSSVTIVDANNPADVLDTFTVFADFLLCIASVPGARLEDYDETTEVIDAGNGADGVDAEGEGTITLVENATPVVPVRSDDDEAAAAENGDGDDESETDGQKKNRMSSVLPTMWLGSQTGILLVHSSIDGHWRECLHSVKLPDAVVSIVHASSRVVTALADGSVAVFCRDPTSGTWDTSRYHLVRLGAHVHSVQCLASVYGGPDGGVRIWCGIRNRIQVLDSRALRVVRNFDAHPRGESQVRQLAWLGDGVWVSVRLDSALRLYHAHTYQHLQDVDIEPYVSKMLGTGKLGFSYVRISALLISSNRLWIGTTNGVVISVPLNDAVGPYAAANRGGAGIVEIPGAVVPVPGSGVRIVPASVADVSAHAPPSIGYQTVPYCTMAHAQLSFHGHRDAVKFFVAVPGAGGMSAASSPPALNITIHEESSCPTSPASDGAVRLPPAMLVMSGGEGYIDFRIGDGDMEDSVVLEETDGDATPTVGNTAEGPDATGRPQTAPSNEHKSDRSHLIVWQVALA